MLIEKKVTEYIQLAGSSNPAPGGGSVSALVGSLASAMTIMVASLTLNKKEYSSLSPEIKTKFTSNLIRLEEIAKELEEIIDEDSKAFGGVLQAFKLPKDTESQRTIRSQAIQAGYKEAIEVPYRCGNLCLEVLSLQDVFVEYGDLGVLSDASVGAVMAYAGIQGAFLNIEVNLRSIQDQEFKKSMNRTMKQELELAKVLQNTTLARVQDRLDR